MHPPGKHFCLHNSDMQGGSKDSKRVEVTLKNSFTNHTGEEIIETSIRS